MTTRSRQKLSSILAVFSIIALLLLLVFVWTAVRNGVFSNENDMNAHGSYRFRPINPSESSASEATLIPTDSSKHHPHGHHAHHHRHNESLTQGKLQTHSLYFCQCFKRIRCVRKQCSLWAVNSFGSFHIPWMHSICSAHGVRHECHMQLEISRIRLDNLLSEDENRSIRAAVYSAAKNDVYVAQILWLLMMPYFSVCICYYFRSLTTLILLLIHIHKWLSAFNSLAPSLIHAAIK